MTAIVRSRLAILARTTLGGVVLLAMLGALFLFDATSAQNLFAQLESMGWWAGLMFVGLHALAVVCLVPGMIFPLGAGFLFGVAKGALYVLLGKLLGATLAFLVARHLFGEQAAAFVREHPRLQVLNSDPGQGWKPVLVIRMVPVIPFKLSNYFFGLTRITLRDFFIGTAIGTVPFTFLNVYLGSLAADLTTLGLRPRPDTGVERAIYLIGFVISITGAVVAVVMARRALRRLRRRQREGHSRPQGRVTIP